MDWHRLNLAGIHRLQRPRRLREERHLSVQDGADFEVNMSTNAQANSDATPVLKGGKKDIYRFGMVLILKLT